jgi:hypothetical protein
MTPAGRSPQANPPSTLMGPAPVPHACANRQGKMEVPTLQSNRALRPPAPIKRGACLPQPKDSTVADINVERKGPSVWPWIVGLLVLALLIWALVEMFGGRAEPTVTSPATEAPVIGPTPPQEQAPAMLPPPLAAPGEPGGAPAADQPVTAPPTDPDRPVLPGVPPEPVPGAQPAPPAGGQPAPAAGQPAQPGAP